MEVPQAKVCKRCGREQPLAAYRLQHGRWWTVTCKTCEWERQKVWRQTERGAALNKAINARYRQTEKRRAAMKALNASPEVRAKKREWQAGEAYQAWRREYTRSEKRKAVLRRYYESGKGKEQHRRYQATAKGRESLLRGSHKRRARILGQTPFEARLTAAEWEAIKAAHGNACLYCGATDRPLTRDHVIPLKEGGQHVKENVVPACRSCNSRKGSRLAQERRATT